MKSPRTWRSLPRRILLGVGIGVISGVMAIVFYGSVDWCTRFLLGSLGGYHPATIAASPGGFHIASGFTRAWAIPLLAGAGALVAALLVFRVAPETEGHGTDVAIRAINTDPAGTRLRAMPVKMVASAITIGSGGSGGTEGPTAQMAATSASFIAKWAGLDYDQARTVVTAGLAAGVGAIFRAPFGGALLGVELLFRKDREWAMAIPSLIASVVAWALFSWVYGWTPMFGHVPGMHITGLGQLAIFPVLGLICGGLARLYATTFYGAAGLFRRGLFRRWRTWPAAGRPRGTGDGGAGPGRPRRAGHRVRHHPGRAQPGAGAAPVAAGADRDATGEDSRHVTVDRLRRLRRRLRPRYGRRRDRGSRAVAAQRDGRGTHGGAGIAGAAGGRRHGRMPRRSPPAHPSRSPSSQRKPAGTGGCW